MGEDTSSREAEEAAAEGRLGLEMAARRDKLDRLRSAGLEPFALRFSSTASATDLHGRYLDLPAGTETGDRAAVAGRVMLARRHGRLSFLTVRDRTGDIQLLCSEEAMGDGYGLLDLLDLGDIVGAEGVVVSTRRGELSVKVERLQVLSKALRPLPEKWHGLRDADARQRRRYLDLATSLESRRIVEVRAKVLAAFRRVLQARGFVEVETPVLQPNAGGALARPFVTHHRALDIDLYLRIAPELYLKRLLVAGLERVYEIGRNFRNEGMDRDHNPEFTMLEAYQAYGTYEDMMELAEACIGAAALEVRGSEVFDYQGRRLDLRPPWPRRPLLEAVSEALGQQVGLDRTDLAEVARGRGLEVEEGWGPGKIVLELFERLVEPTIWEPVFVKDFPREVSPLARAHRTEAGLTEQFDLEMCGTEIGPAYSELTDPDEQRATFLDQQRRRGAGDEEAHPFDEDFLEALEHGMPPAGGIGLGIDRIVMILADVPSIRDVILFPHRRPER